MSHIYSIYSIQYEAYQYVPARSAAPRSATLRLVSPRPCTRWVLTARQRHGEGVCSPEVLCEGESAAPGAAREAPVPGHLHQGLGQSGVPRQGHYGQPRTRLDRQHASATSGRARKRSPRRAITASRERARLRATLARLISYAIYSISGTYCNIPSL